MTITDTELAEVDDQIPVQESTEDPVVSSHHCVPFFKSDDSQLKFEFFYLIASFFFAVSAITGMHLYAPSLGIDDGTRAMFNAAFGGFLGGWCFDAKWFYRVTARGRNNQYAQLWEPHKFYWRLFIPFISGLVAFAIYLLTSSGMIPFVELGPASSRAAFSMSFVLGYFSDLALTRLAYWAESMLPGASK